LTTKTTFGDGRTSTNTVNDESVTSMNNESSEEESEESVL